VKTFTVALGVLVAIYAVSCVVRGEVALRPGLRGRIFRRGDDPGLFWAGVALYAFVAVVLVLAL